MHFTSPLRFGKLQTLRAGVIVAGVVGLFGPSIALAQSITVSPVTIQMVPGQVSTSLSVISHDTSETALQARIYAWTQADGVDQMSESDNVLASPPLATIPPGGTQVIRLILRHPPQGQEATYRIILDQIPPPAAPGMVRIALRLSIPIFAEPATRVAAHLLFRVERSATGTSLVVTNDGNRHEMLHDIVVTTGKGSPLKVGPSGLPYILAGQSHRWPLVSNGPPPSVGTLVHITAKADGGAQDQTVPINAAP